MICEAVSINNNGFASNGVGCNISVTLSDGSFVEDHQISKEHTSPKKLGFLDNLIRRSPPNPKKEKSVKSEKSWSIFSKKSQPAPAPAAVSEKVSEDEEMARFIEQLELEGRTEEDINMHLAHIHHVKSEPSAPATPPSPAKSKNLVSRFFTDVQQAFKEISFSDADYYPPQYEEDIQGLTISISSAPFYGALPPVTDMTYEDLASLEPVYVGSRCINNLPSCKHDGTPLPGDQTKCSVCLCEFTEGEYLKSLSCVHFFHKDCIDSWLMVGHTCPLCKTLVE